MTSFAGVMRFSRWYEMRETQSRGSWKRVEREKVNKVCLFLSLCFMSRRTTTNKTLSLRLFSTASRLGPTFRVCRCWSTDREPTHMADREKERDETVSRASKRTLFYQKRKDKLMYEEHFQDRKRERDERLKYSWYLFACSCCSCFSTRPERLRLFGLGMKRKSDRHRERERKEQR